MGDVMRRLYWQERKAGWTARAALANAKARVEWEGLEGTHVRFRQEPDDCPRDALSYLEQDDWTDSREGRAVARQVRETAEPDGVWGLIAEYRIDPTREDWEHGASCWGLIGEDFAHIEADLMGECLEELRKARADVCPCCNGTGRKSG
jgi:hypothetical protein